MACFLKIAGRLAACGALVVTCAGMAPKPVRSRTHHSHHERLSVIQTGDNMLCTDEMETDPKGDHFDAVPVSETMDGACLTSIQPVEI